MTDDRMTRLGGRNFSIWLLVVAASVALPVSVLVALFAYMFSGKPDGTQDTGVLFAHLFGWEIGLGLCALFVLLLRVAIRHSGIGRTLENAELHKMARSLGRVVSVGVCLTFVVPGLIGGFVGVLALALLVVAVMEGLVALTSWWVLKRADHNLGSSAAGVVPVAERNVDALD